MPPFSPSTCASAASRNGIRRPIGRMNLPSRMSSANSRTLDGSGCVSTRVIFTMGFWAAALSGNTELDAGRLIVSYLDRYLEVVGCSFQL
jgi:hypothetical protein